MIGQAIADHLGPLWLGGPKYTVSRWLAGKAWTVTATEALAEIGRDLRACRTLEEVVGAFHGYHWIKDPAGAAWDRVYPPLLLLKRGGDDCDGWAMAHAMAAQEALGWPSRIVSYLADPWQSSHHFAVVQDPAAGWWYAIQPQPAVGAPDHSPIFGRFQTIKDALRSVAAAYGVQVLWWDVRHPDWRPDPDLSPAPASAGASL